MTVPCQIRAAFALTALLLAPAAAHAEGSAEKGADVFKKCSACHEALQPKNKIGPNLVGIIGRKAGTVADYTKYSDAMKKAGEGGLVWDKTSLSAYLAAPKTFLPGNRMSFTGLKDPQAIEDVIAYLQSLKP